MLAARPPQKPSRLFTEVYGLNLLQKGSSPKTQMLQSEWEELFRLAHDEQSQQKRIEQRRNALSGMFRQTLESPSEEYRALFALHTAYAIVLKLIAYRVVCDIRFGSALKDYASQLKAAPSVLRTFCGELEDGEVFRPLGILNLLEGDFFSWYCDKAQWTPSLAECVHTLLATLARYEQAAGVFVRSGAVDLFRELYEATVPQIVRASFGEFYTPSWLATHVLESCQLRGSWRALDPCSGSGTFVVTAIERIRKENPEKQPGVLLGEILSRVVAIDLNPLAVLTTRVNYFIHIADLIPKGIRSLIIPVYLGDPSYIPEEVEVDRTRCLRYQLTTLKEPIQVTMPLSLVRDTPKFVEAMRDFELSIRLGDPATALSLLLNRIDSADRKESITRLLGELTDHLIRLESRGWNGIWARILTNFLTTACLGRFDAVIGNPPWIDWKNLPAGYRKKIKSLAIERGLFSGAGRTGGINLNICALIAYYSGPRILDQAIS